MIVTKKKKKEIGGGRFPPEAEDEEVGRGSRQRRLKKDAYSAPVGGWMGGHPHSPREPHTKTHRYTPTDHPPTHAPPPPPTANTTRSFYPSADVCHAEQLRLHGPSALDPLPLLL